MTSKAEQELTNDYFRLRRSLDEVSEGDRPPSHDSSDGRVPSGGGFRRFLIAGNASE